MPEIAVVYVGNFRPSWSTENHLALSLEELGVRVIRVQEDQHTAEQVADIARDGSFLLWTRTWGLKGDAARMLRELRIPSVAYHLDLYAGLPRSKDIDTEPWWRCRYVWTADGGSPQFWEEHRVTHIWAPPGVIARECYLAVPDERLRCDVLFVGSYRYHPEWSYRPRLIDNLKARYGARFRHVFENTEATRGHGLNRIYASAKVAVGDCCCLGFDHPAYWSDRVPETLGRGGFLVHPEVSGLEQGYRYGEHLATYRLNDWDGLWRVIDHYLDHDDQREAIRHAGHEHVKAHHTYTHRMRRLLDFLAGQEGIRA